MIKAVSYEKFAKCHDDFSFVLYTLQENNVIAGMGYRFFCEVVSLIA